MRLGQPRPDTPLSGESVCTGTPPPSGPPLLGVALEGGTILSGSSGPNRALISSPSSSTGEHSLFPFFFPLFISGSPIFLFPFLPQEAVMDVRWMLDGLDRCLDECSDRFGTHKQRPAALRKESPRHSTLVPTIKPEVGSLSTSPLTCHTGQLGHKVSPP